jgi:hypothetical protein
VAVEFFLRSISSITRTVFLTCRKISRYGTDGFTSPPKEVVLTIFIAVKNPSTASECEPAILGSSGKHATTRPSRATCEYLKMTAKFLVFFVITS